MPTIQSGWIWVDLGCKHDTSAEIANADVVIVTVPVPVAGTVKAIKLVADILPTSATVVVSKAVGTTDTNLAASVTINSALTANVAYDVTVYTNAQTMHVSATDMLRATWTFTTIGSGEGFGCLVAIEPDFW